jgi:hypothetical protein
VGAVRHVDLGQQPTAERGCGVTSTETPLWSGHPAPNLLPKSLTARR